MAETEKPVISVVIQTRKTPLMILKRCIQSIRKQTFTKMEIILLDSNEKNSPYKRAIEEEKEFFSDIIYLEIPEEGEFVHGKNAVLKIFQGNYITFISAQDTMPAARLKTVIDFLEQNHSYNVAYTDMTIQQSNILESSDLSLTTQNFSCLAQLIIHRECFQWIGEFDSDLVSHCDDDIWFRINSFHLTYHISSPETTISVCPDCYNGYSPLQSAIGYRQLTIKYSAFLEKHKQKKKRFYQQIAEEYKKANVLHRYIQFQTKAFFIKSSK